MEELGGEMIIKPLDGCGGTASFISTCRTAIPIPSWKPPRTTGASSSWAQRYLPEIRQGDKRMIVLDGRPLGAVLRVPLEYETRGNIHVGAQCVHAALTTRDLEICEALAPLLKNDGLYFVGLDVIGSFLTEVNVTSPTGIQEINALDDVRLESQVIDFVEEKASARSPVVRSP